MALFSTGLSFNCYLAFRVKCENYICLPLIAYVAFHKVLFSVLSSSSIHYPSRYPHLVSITEPLLFADDNFLSFYLRDHSDITYLKNALYNRCFYG